MIVTTYNCGCPILKKPSLIAGSTGLQAPCSPCCFRPSSSSYQSRGHAGQCYVQSKTIEKPKRIISRDKVPCRIDLKNSRYAPSYPQYIPSPYLSSIPPKCSNCCPINVSRISSRRPISATTTSMSKDSMSKQSSKSRSESRLKKKLEMSNKEQAPTDKIVSEIVRKRQPYKEIEAVINDNRVIIRMHKESVKEEYDPPCECVGQVDVKESASNLKKCDDGIAFDMANGSLELCRTSREDTSSMKKIRDREETGCRTLMLYPNVKDGDNIGQISAASHLESERNRRSKVKRLIDLEENPNIFLLRIRKHCDSGDKKQKIDLEFRAPRPWLPRKDKKKKHLTDLSEKLEEYEDKIEENDEQIDIDKEADEENDE
ncbi:uncharacterized protein LOC115243121 [Formica exsecta]|uniref:uncharacterized protein LOC115243121 n=1 Tax=Formica exsecta TaxID=72781 RepID=UPI0011432D55|nr:uncharacterized protein LOC115243121 [Formica exsecta]